MSVLTELPKSTNKKNKEEQKGNSREEQRKRTVPATKYG
jgi:hypothetical protein